MMRALLVRYIKHESGKSGGIAQLGERLHGMQEVSGSIPLTSTNTTFTLQLLTS